MRAAADRFAANILPIVQPLRAEARSLREIANVLNARGVPTARGGKWAPTQIADILRRARESARAGKAAEDHQYVRTTKCHESVSGS
jgi:Recombinase